MNTNDIGNKFTTMFSRAAADELRDDILHSMHLERRRPVFRALSAVAFVAVGAVAMLGAVMLIPKFRRATAGAKEATDDVSRRVDDAVKAASRKANAPKSAEASVAEKVDRAPPNGSDKLTAT